MVKVNKFATGEVTVELTAYEALKLAQSLMEYKELMKGADKNDHNNYKVAMQVSKQLNEYVKEFTKGQIRL